MDRPEKCLHTKASLERRNRHSITTGAACFRALRLFAPVVIVFTGCLAMKAAAEAGASSSGALVVAKGKAVKQVAADRRRVVWETGPLEGENSRTTLLGRTLAGGRKRVLARNVKSSYGLALAAGWVVYADGSSRTRLRAISPNGSKNVVLSPWLAAPFAARGRAVAWIEQVGRGQRVVVRDMRTGRVRLTWRVPRCVRERCYRLSAVTLADRGIVFTRSSTDPDLSWVVRIRFSNRVLTSVAIRNDPQPDLVPSSTGAVYYAFGRGWYRWDFGKRPRGTRFRANPPAPLLAYEHGRWFLSTRRGCDFGVVSIGSGGRRHVVVSARRLRSLVPSTSRSCVWLQAFASAGRRPLSAWALVPRESSEEHSDKGLFGVAFAGRAAR
jgi:hypothetical protein